MRAQFTTDVDLHALVMPILVQGIAMSMFLLSIIAISLDSIPPEKVPSASGISNFVRITTGSFFASLTTTIWDRREALHQTHLSDAASPALPQVSQALAQMQAFGMNAPQVVAGLTRQMVNQSYLLAFDDISEISAAICLSMIVIVWFAHRPAPPTGPIAAD
jgi:DHA2 family multidrug resistance protein